MHPSGHHRDSAGLADGGEGIEGDPALELLGPWFAGGDVEGAKADLISLREGLSFQLGAGRGEYLGWQFLHSFWDCQASGKHDTGDAIQLGGDHRAAVSASKYFMAP